MSLLLDTVVPVFAVVALGYALARRPWLQGSSLGDLAILLTSPALLFSVLSGADVRWSQWSALGGGVLFVTAGTGLLALAYTRAARAPRRAVLLPTIFWNAGNLTLPCARLAFGAEGLEAAAVVFVTLAILSSTAGVWIAKGENGLGEMFRMPLVYGSVGGLAVAATGTRLPRMLMEPIEMLGAMAIPLMLLNLGVQLRNLRVTDLHHSLAVLGMRMGGGAALGLAFVTLFGVSGVDRQVLMLASVMPPAVINVVYAQRYDTEPALVASSIVLGTLASLVSIPTVIYLVA